MNMLAVITARGGSKRIPGKNLISLFGNPLISYTFKAAQESKYIDDIIISTDSNDILEYSQASGIKAPFVRPADLAKDDTPSLPVVKHAVEYFINSNKEKPKYIILLQPTSPLRKAQHIDEAYEKLLNSNADSIVSVNKVPHQFIPESIHTLQNGFLKPYLSNTKKTTISQKKPMYYANNGAIYIFKLNTLLVNNSLYGNNSLSYEMNRIDSIDVDTYEDLSLCEYYMNIMDKK